MSSFNSKEFKKLKAKWYKKLEKSGFEDVERDEFNFKVDGKEIFRKKVQATKQSKEDYYYLASCFLHEHTFPDELSKIIWEYHANGLSKYSIAGILNKTKVTKTNETSVYYIIAELREIMKKKYLKVTE